MAQPTAGPVWDDLLTEAPTAPGTPASAAAGPDWDVLLSQPGADGTPPAAAAATDWNATSAVLNGILLGAGPYIEAASRSIRRGTGFSAELARAKADQAAYESQNPLTSSVLGIAGSIPTVAAATALSPELAMPALFGKAGPLLSRAATVGLQGAEAGALQTDITGGDIRENALTGMMLGTAFPLASAGIRSTLQPVVDTGVAAAAKAANALGLGLRPGQYAMPGFLSKADATLMAGKDAPQLKQATRILSHAIGEDTESITPQVLEDASARIGKGLDAVAANSRMVYDTTLDKRIKDILYQVTSASGISKADQNAVRNVINDIKNSAAFTPTGKSGKAFQQLTQYGSMLGELSQSANPTVRQAGGDLSDALFETVARYSPPDQTKALFDLKDQFKNVLALRKAAEKAGPSGLLNPKDISALATGQASAVRQVSKFLPVPTAVGASKAPAGHGLLPTWAKTAGAVGLVTETHEIAAQALAHPGLTSAAAAAGIMALGARPVARSALGSAWLERLATGQPVFNPLLGRVALPMATGLANQQ